MAAVAEGNRVATPPFFPQLLLLKLCQGLYVPHNNEGNEGSELFSLLSLLVAQSLTTKSVSYFSTMVSTLALHSGRPECESHLTLAV